MLGHQYDLGSTWEIVNKKYSITKFLGSGAYGQVMKCICRTTHQVVAIKMISNFIEPSYEFKKVMREIQIMKNFKAMKTNIFTTRLVEIIVPDEENFDSIFIVMEYMPSDLRNFFNRSV